MQVMPSNKARELLAAGRADEDARAAERASQNMLASILRKGAGAPTQQFYGAFPVLGLPFFPHEQNASLPPTCATSSSQQTSLPVHAFLSCHPQTFAKLWLDSL